MKYLKNFEKNDNNSLIKKCKYCGYDIKLNKNLDMWQNIHADKSKEKRNSDRLSYDMYCIINGKYHSHLPE